MVATSGEYPKPNQDPYAGDDTCIHPPLDHSLTELRAYGFKDGGNAHRPLNRLQTRILPPIHAPTHVPLNNSLKHAPLGGKHDNSRRPGPTEFDKEGQYNPIDRLFYERDSQKFSTTGLHLQLTSPGISQQTPTGNSGGGKAIALPNPIISADQNHSINHQSIELAETSLYGMLRGQTTEVNDASHQAYSQYWSEKLRSQQNLLESDSQAVSSRHDPQGTSIDPSPCNGWSQQSPSVDTVSDPIRLPQIGLGNALGFSVSSETFTNVNYSQSGLNGSHTGTSSNELQGFHTLPTLNNFPGSRKAHSENYHQSMRDLNDVQNAQNSRNPTFMEAFSRQNFDKPPSQFSGSSTPSKALSIHMGNTDSMIPALDSHTLQSRSFPTNISRTAQPSIKKLQTKPAQASLAKSTRKRKAGAAKTFVSLDMPILLGNYKSDPPRMSIEMLTEQSMQMDDASSPYSTYTKILQDESAENENYDSTEAQGRINANKTSEKYSANRHKCPKCGNMFVNLRTHLSTHVSSESRPHLCTICGRGFSRINDLSRHQHVHTEQLPFICPLHVDPDIQSGMGLLNYQPCHATGKFSRRDTYKNHLKALHFAYPDGIRKASRRDSAGKCKGCGSIFENADTWISRHIETRECSGISAVLHMKCHLGLK